MPFSMLGRYWPSWLQNGCSISQDHIPHDNISKTRENGFLLSVSLWRKHFLGQTAYFPLYLLAELGHMAIFKPIHLEGNEMTKTGLSQPRVKYGSERSSTLPEHSAAEHLKKTEVLLTRKEWLSLSNSLTHSKCLSHSARTNPINIVIEVSV